MGDERELFKGTAWYYSRYRKGYPSAFFNYIVKAFNLDNTSRALDLGTGTGQIAIPLSSFVKEVIAIDPEREMLDEGERIANEKGISNIKWAKLKAEDISDGLRYVRHNFDRSIVSLDGQREGFEESL